VIYLDSCAIVKLVAPEPESAALKRWLDKQSPAGLFTSKLSEVEVPRALRRNRPGVLGAAAGVLRYLDRVEINDVVRATAAAYIEPSLRSLDAIHLATAEAVVAAGKSVTEFVTYDTRLAKAASEVGLKVVAPGASGNI
jgi:predicted nucleic acid-binding protein